MPQRPARRIRHVHAEVVHVDGATGHIQINRTEINTQHFAASHQRGDGYARPFDNWLRPDLNADNIRQHPLSNELTRVAHELLQRECSAELYGGNHAVEARGDLGTARSRRQRDERTAQQGDDRASCGAARRVETGG